MKPAKLDLPTIWRGCDWGPVILKWKDQNGDPISLTGWQPKAESLNINLQPTITDAAQGVTQLYLAWSDTANLKLGTENWDWIWERTQNQYRFPPFLAGKVTIKEPLTTIDQHAIGPAPDNDDFSNATLIQGENGSIEGTNVNATRESLEPAGENTVWYQWTPDRQKQATLGIGMNWLNIHIYTGATIDQLTLIATATGNPRVVTFNAQVATTYWVRLSKATRTSSFNLYWRMQEPPP